MNAVDTNVYVYALDAGEQVKQAKAVELLKTRRTELIGNTFLKDDLQKMLPVISDPDSESVLTEAPVVEGSPVPMVRVPRLIRGGAQVTLRVR